MCNLFSAAGNNREMIQQRADEALRTLLRTVVVLSECNRFLKGCAVCQSCVLFRSRNTGCFSRAEFDPKRCLRFLLRQLNRTDALTQYVMLWEHYNGIYFGTE